MPQTETESDSEAKRKSVTRGVLSTERAAQKVVTNHVKAIANHASAYGMSAPVAAMLVGSAATTAIATAREAATQRSAAAFERQTDLTVEANGDIDTEEATEAGEVIGRRFAEHVREAVAEGSTLAAAFPLAVLAVQQVIRGVVTTQVMQAWNGEARRLAKASLVSIVQTWHAELDACPNCADFDGKTVRGRETFAEGDPPLHPHCRCYISSDVDEKSIAKEEPTESEQLWAARQRESEAAIAAERARVVAAREQHALALREAKAERAVITQAEKPTLAGLAEITGSGAQSAEAIQTLEDAAHPIMVEALRKNPLGGFGSGGELAFEAGDLREGRSTNGLFENHSNGTVIRIAVRQHGLGDTAWSMTTRARDEREARKVSLFHEFGHHLHQHGWHHTTSSYVKANRVVQEAFAARARTITEYAETNAPEYFAESFAAYLDTPEVLRERDPGAVKMVEEVLNIRGVRGRVKP